MSYVLRVGSLVISTTYQVPRREPCTCQEAEKGCRPAYVFSINGQVRFRHALDHLLRCQDRRCSALRRKVIRGMGYKLRWLRTEGSVVGCSSVQAELEAASSLTKLTNRFPQLGRHLVHCPHEACAQLRRALLLSVRQILQPAAKLQ